jgi:chemotaxis protein histidine kinase CheA
MVGVDHLASLAMGKRSRRRGEPTEPQGGAEPREEPAAAEGAPLPLRPDGRLREVALLVEEADYLLALYRWIVLTGDVPRAQDWLRREEWPHPDYVVDVYGSWEKFLQHAEIPSSPLLARVREADGERRSVAARQQQAERDLARVEDLRRQVETAKRRREAADTERTELSARAERLAGQLERAEARAAAAEAHLAERRQHAESAVGARGEASDEWLAAHEALLDELDTVRAHREELLRQVEELREAAAQDAKAIAHLSTTLSEAAGGAEIDGAAAEPQEPPARVAEAVERAAAQAQHLVFTRAAHEAAADSPYRRPADVLDALMRLDDLAALYADPEGFGRSLGQAADELGLTWRQNVSGLARSRKPHAYSVTHDGERLELGPHVAIGSGSGAGFIARVYLHVADGSSGVPRGLYVGHVGRHLPDTTTA